MKHFQLRYNLDPRGLLQTAELLKHVYRDALRQVLVIGCPWAFSSMWGLLKKVLPAKTASKIRFLTAEQAVSVVKQHHGAKAAERLKAVISANHGPGPGAIPRFPSEV